MIYINSTDPRPIYLQIYEAIRNDILTGAIPEGTALQPIRSLAEDLYVSKNTVDHAYQQLLEEGLVRTVKGSGYYVEDFTKMYLHQENSEISFSCPDNDMKQQSNIKYDFRYSVSDTYLFPWTKWKQYVMNAISYEANNQFQKYECNKGYYPLRAELSAFLHRTRGVQCSPEQIVICAGTQYAVEMVMNLIPKHKKVAFEDPGFLGMRKVFSSCNCEIKPIPIQKDGLNIEMLKKYSADIIYLTPSHQFPTGITTSMDKRFQLLDLVNQNNGYIIENDYDSEFHYSEHILPSIQSLDKNSHVIYTGTLSKAMSASIRCAYCILPEPILNLYEEKYRHFNSSLSTFIQRAISEFIKDGFLDKHVLKISRLNAFKYEQLIQQLKCTLPDSVHIIDIPAGSHILLKVDCCKEQSDLIEFMKKRSIGIHGAKKHWSLEPSPDNLFILGFSSIPKDKIEKYALILSSALREYVSQRSGNSL